MELLSFLAEPWFVIPWYAFGAVAAIWVWWDLHHTNTVVKKAIGWGWPIIALFFSVVGLALYFATARAPGVGQTDDQKEKKRRHDEYEKSMLRRVNGAVIHCVAGDGLGIMTAMVIARLLEMNFWQEFWFEYLVGFAFGWFIFQYKSMTMMTDSKGMALAMAFRAEFFSMLTVMGGMGAVMAWVTPSVVGMQPKPDTAAFWGFGMLGLMLGYVFTFPMNWMMVAIQWKHGMGSPGGSRHVDSGAAKGGLLAVMCGLGAVALAIPAWLTIQREQAGAEVTREAVAQSGISAQGTGTAQASPARQSELTRAMGASAGPGAEGGDLLRPAQGLAISLTSARQHLLADERLPAVSALDAAYRAAEVRKAAFPGESSEKTLKLVKDARHALQNNNTSRAAALLSAAADTLPAGQAQASSSQAAAASNYVGVPLVNAAGAVVGEVSRVRGNEVELALGGVHDFWGFWDVSEGRKTWVQADALTFGPKRWPGKSYVMVPAVAAAN